MATYLRVINPIVAVLIFLLCLYAASTPDATQFDPAELLAGGFSTYFVAKGIFCGIAIFLLGKILEVMLANTR